MQCSWIESNNWTHMSKMICTITENFAFNDASRTGWPNAINSDQGKEVAEVNNHLITKDYLEIADTL